VTVHTEVMGLRIVPRLAEEADSVQTGDPVFDREVRLGGDLAGAVAASLSEEQRSVLLQVVRAGATFDDGAWRIRRPKLVNSQELRAVVRSVVDGGFVLRQALGEGDVGSASPVMDPTLQALSDAFGLALASDGRSVRGQVGSVAVEAGLTTHDRVEVRAWGEQNPWALRVSGDGRRLARARTDLHSGDDDFDTAVFVMGEDEARALSRFDGPAREAIGRAIAVGARLEQGVWRVRLAEDPQTAVGEVRAVLDAAEELDRTAGPSAQGLRTLLADPLPAVRQRAAEVLLDREGPAVVAELLAHRDAAVRRPAAIAGAGAGMDVEEELLTHLDEPDVALIDALGAVGTLRAVAALREVCDGAWPAAVRRRASQALRRILKDAEPGSLSVAPAEGGEVSLATPRPQRRRDPEGGRS
jgi:hypothetical protein